MHRAFQTAPSSNENVTMNFTSTQTTNNVEHGNSAWELLLCCFSDWNYCYHIWLHYPHCVRFVCVYCLQTMLKTMTITSYRYHYIRTIPRNHCGQYINDKLHCVKPSTTYSVSWTDVSYWRGASSNSSVLTLSSVDSTVNESMFSDLITAVHSWRNEHHYHCSKLESGSLNIKFIYIINFFL